MRTALLVCACLATLAGGVRVFAQDDTEYSDASDSAVYASAPGCGTGTDETPCGPAECGPSDDGIEYGPACQYPTGPPQNPHACGMGYYAKRAAQKTDAAVYGALSGAMHPCETLHTIVENDIDRKLKHCKCLGRHYGNRIAATRAAQTPWHGDYYYPLWARAGGPGRAADLRVSDELQLGRAGPSHRADRPSIQPQSWRRRLQLVRHPRLSAAAVSAQRHESVRGLLRPWTVVGEKATDFRLQTSGKENERAQKALLMNL